ncbi:MAG: coenzyme F420-reducing hydrogenase, FrhD protein [Methanoregula sp.]|uniref:coenzyme F420-reducing hydrogenase, FrhD protein n=1 Tax=Methanoregula sp. TaxID=2052170 RepID=UPI0025EC99E4|nr:coenzyme F420-reducing hydrogenase, FrhD protein [Methanoregula sp.]MCK9632634.1 coenzyme F420-reducing hydrogenase, FrhD protein [Methanoregula sp.]
MYPEIVIAGCGNPLFADDGFGPAVAEEMFRIPLPGNVMVQDAGTSAPYYLVPMLDPAVTKKLIIIDITDFGGEPGRIIRLETGDLNPEGIHDSHNGGIIESLQCIRNKIEIIIIGCQPKHVSYPVMEIGLSDEVIRAIPTTLRIIGDLLDDDRRDTCDRSIGKKPADVP